MSTPESKHAPVSDSPTWADTPTRTEITPQPEFESHAIQAIAARYEVVSELGRGGMGLVLKVRDRETEDIVALKLLHPEIAANKEWEQRFKDELRLARKITHKNVCRMYELLRFGDTAAIAMEYVEGETLRQVMRRFGGLPFRKAIEVVQEICGGLREAHAQGVVHRDLKPENVIIDWAGSVRIMDFGLARSAEAMTASSAESRGITGTPEYMSPEQASGKHADARSDIYALGLILYELLTGRAPFRADSAMAVALKHINEPPPAPRELDPTIPHHVERVILRCLEKNPAKRFQTVEELEAALTSKEKLKEVDAPEAEPEDVPLPMHLARWQRSDYKLAGVAAVALVIFFALFDYVTPFHYVHFLPAGEAVKIVNADSATLGVPGGAKDCVVELPLLSYQQIAVHTDPAWLADEMTRYASGWRCRIEHLGDQAVWGVNQKGEIVYLWVPAQAEAVKNLAGDELKHKIVALARQLTGRTEAMEERFPPAQAGLPQATVSLIAKNRPNLPEVYLNANFGNFAASIFANRFNRQGQLAGWQWRANYGGQQPPQSLLIVTCLVAVALFFARRLHRRRLPIRVAAIAAIATALLMTGIRPHLYYAVLELLPNWVIYTWQGSMRDLFAEWQPVVHGLLITFFVLLVFLVTVCVTAVVNYYGRRGDPSRTRSVLRRFEGWASVAGLGTMRGALLGTALAGSFIGILVALRWTRVVFADAEWMATVTQSWSWNINLSHVSGWSHGYRLFAVAALEALVVGVLVALPASVAARANAKRAITVAAAGALWIVTLFSLCGATTYDPMVGLIGMAIQIPIVVLAYLHYDLLTAMMTVFSAEMLLMTHASYKVFRTYPDSTYYVVPLLIWAAVVLAACATYFWPQLAEGLRRTAKVFE
jgi:predicted Ser/Thr protein kinase